MVAPSRTLYVSGIDQSVSTDTLEEEFSRHAKVEKVTIIKDKMTQESKGFAYVLMASIDDAQKSIKELDGKVLAEKPIKVMFSFSDNPGPPDSRGSFRGRGGGRFSDRGGSRFSDRGGSRFSSSYRGSDRGGYSSYRGRGSDRGGSTRGRGFSSRGHGGYGGRDDMSRSSRGGGRGRGSSRYDGPSYRDRDDYPRRDVNGSYDDYDRGRAPSVRNIDSYSRGSGRDSYGRGAGRDSYGRGAPSSDYGRPPPRYETERRSSFGGPRDSYPTSDYRDRSPPPRAGAYDERPVRSMGHERDRFDDRGPPARRPVRPEPRSEQYRDERPMRRDYDSMPGTGRHDSYPPPRSTRDYDPPARRPPPRDGGGYAGYGSDVKDDYGPPPRYRSSYGGREY